MRKYGNVSQGTSPVITNGGQTSRTPAINTSGLSSSIRPAPGSAFSMPDSRMSSATSSRANSPNLHPLVNENDVSGPSSPISGFPPVVDSRTTLAIQPALARRTPGENITIPAVSTPPAPVSVAPKPVQVTLAAATPQPQPQIQPQPQPQPLPLPQQHQMQPPIISFGASAIQGGVPAPLDTVGSRFYVKRRVVVGNVSKYLPEEKRDPRLKDFPYKWMIYVDGTPKPEDITAYIAKVEFHLHESYKPNHVVTVSEAPFHLSRYAWGETQIKVRLFFHDERNKPVEVYHRLAVSCLFASILMACNFLLFFSLTYSCWFLVRTRSWIPHIVESRCMEGSDMWIWNWTGTRPSWLLCHSQLGPSGLALATT